MKVIKALAKQRNGLSRNEIIATCHLKSGGGTSQILEELSESGFIEIFIPYGNMAKDSIYKLVDEYTLFIPNLLNKER